MPGNPADQSRPTPDHQRELLKLFGSLAYRHSAWQVFADFAEAAAISLSNAVDWAQRDPREERYMALIKRYKPDELAVFPQMLGELTLALEEEPSDVLGRTFHDLELHNKWSGQYFSPYPLCRMMAKMTLSNEEDIRARISERGFVTAQEPACGSGAMVIALAQGMKDLGINYQQHLHVTAVDVDPKCVHMAYLQFALLHIPAVVVHGNTLSLEEFGRWYTPAHIMDGWNWKLRREPEGTQKIEGVPESPKPQKPGADDTRPPLSQLTLF
jgi:N-6 DNA Methylase